MIKRTNYIAYLSSRTQDRVRSIVGTKQTEKTNPQKKQSKQLTLNNQGPKLKTENVNEANKPNRRQNIG
jgi:hypothetical protein